MQLLARRKELSQREEVRVDPLSERERRAAAAAAAWILAYNARWQAALIDHGFCGSATIALVRHHQKDSYRCLGTSRLLRPDM
jgi:hypothetical protein